ncbi:aromatic acid decarboxylase [Sulfolobus acidocaldarius SUSAZ]|nr:aromatic acid decarboxylase [Sulfolobus acidocaldarius SUSAZ]
MGERLAEESRTTERSKEKRRNVVVGISGASGVIYGIRTVKTLNDLGYNQEIIISNGAIKVAEKECGLDLVSTISKFVDGKIYREEEIDAPPSSSSHVVKSLGMVVVPCSIKTLAEISNGLSSNLISRTALNFLRIKGKLVLVLRETPLGAVELRNALRVTNAGAIVLPASPGFYHNPKTFDDLVNFVVGKILDMLGIENNLYKHWDTSSKTDQRPCDQVS